MIHLKTRQFFVHLRPQIVVAARGTATALAALAVAVYFKLESPYWAAMTALIVIQPTRGLLLEKSLYRLAGTSVGSLAGLILLQSFHAPISLTIALSLWIAGCVGIGNLLYGFRSYACLLAGYTCAIISMLGFQDQPHLGDLAFARVAGIMVDAFAESKNDLSC